MISGSPYKRNKINCNVDTAVVFTCEAQVDNEQRISMLKQISNQMTIWLFENINDLFFETNNYAA